MLNINDRWNLFFYKYENSNDFVYRKMIAICQHKKILKSANFIKNKISSFVELSYEISDKRFDRKMVIFAFKEITESYDLMSPLVTNTFFLNKTK